MGFDTKKEYDSKPFNVRVDKKTTTAQDGKKVSTGERFFNVTKNVPKTPENEWGVEHVSNSANVYGKVLSFSFVTKVAKADNKVLNSIHFTLLDEGKNEIMFVEMFEDMFSNEFLNKLHGGNLKVPLNFWLAIAQEDKSGNGNYVNKFDKKGRLVPIWNIRPVSNGETKEKLYRNTLWNDEKSDIKCDNPLVGKFKEKSAIASEVKGNTIVANLLRDELFVPWLLEQGFYEKVDKKTSDKYSSIESRIFKLKSAGQSDTSDEGGNGAENPTNAADTSNGGDGDAKTQSDDLPF